MTHLHPGGALPDRFRAHLAGRRLFASPGVAVIAVSGGADSVALLDLMAGVAEDSGLTLVVAHADHGIHPDSAATAQLVASLAARYGLEAEVGELRLGARASETRARAARYTWLHDVMQRRAGRYLVTAHHQDDQVETVLLRLLRGSAPAGLAGIATRSRGGVIRPLLPFARSELAAHVRVRGLPFFEDPANRDPRHLRSWLRAVLLPLLVERLGPGVSDRLLDLRRHSARDRRAWDRVLDFLPGLDLRVDGAGFDVARPILGGYDDALAAAVLRAAARRAGLVLGPVRAHRIAALAQGTSGRELPLGQGWRAAVEFDRLRISRQRPAVDSPLGVVSNRGEAMFGGFRIEWHPDAAPMVLERRGWCTWVGEGNWALRAPQSKDSVVPLGGVGRRPLRRLFMEARVPRASRPGYPVVVRGETILWVPGICRSAAEIPAPGTRAVRIDVTPCGAAEADRRP